VIGILAAHGPQRLDLDERFAVTTADPVPPLPRRRTRAQHMVEDLVVLAGGNGIHRGGHLIDTGVQRISQEPPTG